MSGGYPGDTFGLCFLKLAEDVFATEICGSLSIEDVSRNRAYGLWSFQQDLITGGFEISLYEKIFALLLQVKLVEEVNTAREYAR